MGCGAAILRSNHPSMLDAGQQYLRQANPIYTINSASSRAILQSGIEFEGICRSAQGSTRAGRCSSGHLTHTARLPDDCNNRGAITECPSFAPSLVLLVSLDTAQSHRNT